MGEINFNNTLIFNPPVQYIILPCNQESIVSRGCRIHCTKSLKGWYVFLHSELLSVLTFQMSVLLVWPVPVLDCWELNTNSFWTLQSLELITQTHVLYPEPSEKSLPKYNR